MSPADPRARQRARTRRRQLGFVGLVAGAFAIVEAKGLTAPAPHRLNLPVAAAPSPAATAPASGGGGSGSTGSRTVTGQPVDIGYGIVQVKLQLNGNRVSAVIPLQLPSGGRSGDIASYAVPQLRTEVLAAQSPNIDTVSGATYTSEGYARSVQSALDAARK